MSEFSLYDVLGLGSNGAIADDDAIKKAYHKAVLLYHPDKMQNSGNSDDRSIFLKIQEAFSTLLDEKKRRAYDSQLDFDESVPTLAEIKNASKVSANHYCSFVGPFFVVNARFAERKPVPSIGDDQTSIDQVYQFYDYWVKFDSWRDFTNVNCEHNPDSATSREEKRWMIKENDRNAKKLKKKEMGRIMDFVMIAMENDPRIIADNERKKQQKEAAKLAREQEQERIIAKQLEDERLQQIAAEEQKNNAKATKADREKIKKLESKIRSTFRKLVSSAQDNRSQMKVDINETTQQEELSTDDIELICTKVSIATLQDLNESFGGENALKDVTQLRAVEGLTSVLNRFELVKSEELLAAEEEKRLREERKKEAEERARAMDRRKKGLDRELTRDEISALAKALGKYPAGTRNRWECISTALNEALQPEFPFTPDECTRCAHNAMQFLATLKLNEKTPIAAAQIPVSTPASTPAPSTHTPNTAAAAVQGDGVSVSESPSTSVAKQDSDHAVKSPSPSIWTQEQQKMLEAGLLKYPSSMDKAERWAKIADEVIGKTKKDCLERFKELRAQVQNKAQK